MPGLTIVVELGTPTCEWSWGDGSGGSSGTSRGRAYASGDDVPEGRGTPLVSHIWASPGSKTLTVMAVYPLAWRWNGTGGPWPPLRATSSVPVPVQAARSQLVRR